MVGKQINEKEKKYFAIAILEQMIGPIQKKTNIK